MRQKIIITAANGFLGNALVQYFKKEYEIIALVRKLIPNENNVQYYIWDGKTLGKWQSQFENATVVINLAGRSVDCRYNSKNKRAIYTSRLESTQVIADAIQACKQKPQVWLNSASATIYRHSLDKPMTDSNGEYGAGFSVDVCQQCKRKFFENKIEGVRQVALRTAIVLGKNGGVMKPFLTLSRFGVGGKMGKGNQRFSWIHIDDFCRAVEFLILNDSCENAFNISSPNPIANSLFMKNLRQVVKMPFGVPLPKCLLELGARIIKTETELILKSRYVIPEKLLNAGFEFKFPKIEQALMEIVS